MSDIGGTLIVNECTYLWPDVCRHLAKYTVYGSMPGGGNIKAVDIKKSTITLLYLSHQINQHGHNTHEALGSLCIFLKIKNMAMCTHIQYYYLQSYKDCQLEFRRQDTTR